MRAAVALGTLFLLAMLAWRVWDEPLPKGSSSSRKPWPPVAPSRTSEKGSAAKITASDAAPASASTRSQDVAACQRAMATLACTRQRSELYFARAGKHHTLPTVDAECDALPADAKSWRPVFEAARRGHVPSMARFADGALFRLDRVDSEWDLEAMAFYRDYGHEFLTRAASTGDGGAVQKLATEMMTPGYGPGVVPYDPVRGLAYAKVLLRHAKREWRDHLENRMGVSLLRFTPLEWARAEAMSREILSPEAELALEGWSPLARDKDAGYGCDF